MPCLEVLTLSGWVFSRFQSRNTIFVGMWKRPDVCKSEIINILARVDILGQGGKLALLVGTMMSEGVEKSLS